MNNISIKATERTPGVEFDFANSTFSLTGESYPEDVADFYGPILKDFNEHLNGANGKAIQFTFDLIYFNSSTAKVIMGLFEALDEAGENNTVTATWKYEEDDDNMEEMGEEFGEDLVHAKFELIEVEQS